MRRQFYEKAVDDPLNAVRAALAVTDQDTQGRIGVAQIVALRAWTGVPGRADGLGAKRAPCALALALGHAIGTRFADVADIVGCAWLEGARRFALVTERPRRPVDESHARDGMRPERRATAYKTQ